MSPLRALLLPFSLLYHAATAIRNHLFDIGHKKSFQFEIPVIGVGNLSVGGSGKTPTIEYLIRLLQPKFKIATLSRGYGRNTKGLRYATDGDNAKSLGDEPFQIFRKFKDNVKVVVSEDRAFAIPNLMNEYPDVSVVLMDDALQHRSVKPHFQILLTDYSTPFFKDFILPSGRLRESRLGASRADAVVVTKCPEDISDSRREYFVKSIKKHAGDKPIFFSYVDYGSAAGIWGNEFAITRKVILLSGIAKPKAFEKYAKSQFEVVKHYSFADHHHYTESELQQIRRHLLRSKKPLSLLTTEKDMVRLIDPRHASILSDLPCFYLPIQVNFKESGAEFDKLVVTSVEKALRSQDVVDE